MKKSLFLVPAALLAIGCGGGSDGGGGVAQPVAGNPIPAPTAAAPVTPTGDTTIVSGAPNSFQFPTFSNASKLVVVANYQTPTQSPGATASLQATLSGIGAAARGAQRFAEIEDGESVQGFNPCGYGDVAALDQLFGEDDPSFQSTVIRPRFQALAKGDETEFYLIPASKKVTAQKMLSESQTVHCTIFAEVLNGVPAIDEEKALAVAEAFDTNNPERPGGGIYSQVRQVFGSEWNQNPPGGNDGDEKVVIMFFSPTTLGQNLFGYVSPADARPDGGTTSNKGEIIYVNGGKELYQTLATISHEFQHVTNQNQKINRQGQNPESARQENVSINEGLSGLSEEVCGYTFESGNDLLAIVTNDYLEKPDDHEFFNFFAGGLGYGQGYLFFRYVREHFGDSAIRAIATDPGVGVQNLDAHLPVGFAETFRRWTVANYATNLTGSVPRIYRYPSGFKTNGTYPAGTLVGVRTRTASDGQSTSTPTLGPWSSAYLAVENRPGTGLEVDIDPAGDSAYGLVYEALEGTFTEFRN